MRAWILRPGGGPPEGVTIETSGDMLREVREKYLNGGWCEILSILWMDKPRHMAVDEDGRMKQLEVNELATALYGRDVIVGTAVIFEDPLP